MIPQIEERQGRPCSECIALDHEYYKCQAGYDVATKRDKAMEHWKENLYEISEQFPCKGHLTPEEYQELVDSGVV